MSQLPQRQEVHPVLKFMAMKKDALMQAVPTALQGSVTWTSIIQGVGMALEKNAQLGRCEPRSIFASVLYGLRLGLDPSGQTGEFWLIPYGQDCTGQIAAYGKLRLAQRFGGVIIHTCNVVFEKDTYDYDEGSNYLTHKRATGDRGKPLFAYFRCWKRDSPLIGTKMADHQEIMSLSDFEHIRDEAKRKNKGKLSPAYENWPTEMFRRSVISRACKALDKSPDLLNLMGEARAIYEKEAGKPLREKTIDESGSVILDDDFGTPTPQINEDLNVPADMDPRTGEVIDVKPASEVFATTVRNAESDAIEAPVTDPETGERVPEPEELEPKKKKEAPPKAGSQQKISGMP